MILGDIANRIGRSARGLTGAVGETFGEPTLRLGVTGLSRAGKTVFITSLVANLMDRGRMSQLAAAAEGRIDAAYLQPQPDDTLPRFDYEKHLAALTADAPHWPESTRAVSELRLSMRIRPTGLLAGFQGARRLHLDIVDYPGEWLLDLGLLEKSFEDWSRDTLARAERREIAGDFLSRLKAEDSSQELEEARAQALSESFTAYLRAASEAGYSDCSPGRFLLPGDLAGSPVLTFAPLPPGDGTAGRKSLRREFERRYEAYKDRVVKPFFRDHFSRIDRQIVLVDALGAIHRGPGAVEDLRHTMSDVLSAFRPGRNAFLSQILMGKRVERILFAATKADHLHHRQHPHLSAFMQALTREAADRAHFAGARTDAMAIAALRATVEETRSHRGEDLDCVRGTLTSGKSAAFYPGELPQDPQRLLGPARDGSEHWLDADYGLMTFAPAKLSLRPGEGPPHIRLDRAAQFLFGDRL